MSEEEFDQIDHLSGGKLRHLLVGSPSGYEWNETVLKVFFVKRKKLDGNYIAIQKQLG